MEKSDNNWRNQRILKILVLCLILYTVFCDQSNSGESHTRGNSNSIDLSSQLNINTTDGNTKVIKLGPPIENPTEAQAFPPIHKHGQSQSHESSGISTSQAQKIEIQNNTVNSNDSKSESGLIPSLLNQEVNKTNTAAELVHEKDIVNSGTIYTNNSYVDSAKQPVKDEIDLLVEAIFSNQPDTLNSNYNSTETTEVHKLIDINPEADSAKRNSTNFLSEPETGMHGVKLMNGHLHFNNKTYSFYDPGKATSRDISMSRYAWKDYFIILVFCSCFFAFVLFVGWVLLKICRKLFGQLRYSEFSNERNDSISSASQHYADFKEEEFRRNELNGELDPAIFYKHQSEAVNSYPSSNKRNITGFNMGIENTDRDYSRYENQNVNTSTIENKKYKNTSFKDQSSYAI